MNWRVWGTASMLCVVGCGAPAVTPASNTPAVTPNGSLPDGSPGMLSNATDGGGAGYLPLATGASWTYQVTTAAGTVSQHKTVIEAIEPSPTAQQLSFRIRYELPDAVKLEWEQPVGAQVVRYEEHQIDASGNTTAGKIYTPSELVLDESPEHLIAGASWTEAYQQTKTPSKKGATTSEQAHWTVQAVDEMVTVPAGTFSCLKIMRLHTSSKSPVPEVAWYAAGIGKIKETAAGPNNDETLELVSRP